MLHYLKISQNKRKRGTKTRFKSNHVNNHIKRKYAIKRHSLSDWIKIEDSTICCLQWTHLKFKDINRLKAAG